MSVLLILQLESATQAFSASESSGTQQYVAKRKAIVWYKLMDSSFVPRSNRTIKVANGPNLEHLMFCLVISPECCQISLHLNTNPSAIRPWMHKEYELQEENRSFAVP